MYALPWIFAGPGVKMSSASELAEEYEHGLGDDINPGTGG